MTAQFVKPKASAMLGVKYLINTMGMDVILHRGSTTLDPQSCVVLARRLQDQSDNPLSQTGPITDYILYAMEDFDIMTNDTLAWGDSQYDNMLVRQVSVFTGPAFGVTQALLIESGG